MSRIRSDRIVNRAAGGPVEASEGILIPSTKPLTIGSNSGTEGQYLRATGGGLEWSNLPVATYNTFGLVKPGSTFSISENGTLEVSGTTYVLPKASASVRGGIKVGTALSIDSDGVLSANTNYQNLTNKPELKTVAVTGDYNDLINKPLINIIPANVVVANSSPTFTNLTVSGNLTVTGTTTTANVSTLNVTNNEIILNENITGAPLLDAYITANRGALSDAKIRWNENIDRWEFTNDGISYQNIPLPTEYGSYQNLTNKPTIPVVLDDLTDVQASYPAATDILKYNGIFWEAGTVSSILPKATASVLGGIKVGNNLIVSSDGTLNATAAPYVLTAASASVLGGIKVGNNLSINADGVLSATATPYTLPQSTAFTLGGVKVDGNTIVVDDQGVISATGATADADGGYILPKASATTLGGIKVGSNLSIDVNGVLSATATPYTLPTASATVLGGIKIGAGLLIDGNGVVTASSGTTLAGLTDVDINAPLATNDFLQYNGNNGKWENVQGISTNDLIWAGGGIEIEKLGSGASYAQGLLSFVGGAGISIGYGVNATGTAGQVITANGSGGIQWSSPATAGSSYTLPIASGSTLGGVKVGANLVISGDGVLSATNSYTLPTASTTVSGGVKVDGTTIVINGSGVISATGGGSGGYTLPPATSGILGGVKVGSGLSVAVDGTLSATGGSSLTRSTLTMTGTVAPGVTTTYDLTAPKTYAILSITTTHDSWVRVYTSAAARTADASRSETVDPAPGIGLVCEIRKDGKQLVTPAAIGFNDDNPVQGMAYISIVGREPTSNTQTTTIQILPLETV